MSFGTFNPNFYGITQSFADPDWLDAYEEYAHEEDVRKWRGSQQDFDFDRLGTLSTADHELRHFHDSLISPWSIERMIWRLNASINGLFAIQNIRSAKGGYVPLPISRWMGWSEAERETWLRSSGAELTSLSDLVRLSSVDFSKPITMNDLRLLADLDEMFPGAQEGASRSYRRLETMRTRTKSGMGFDLRVDDVFEASAHVLHATTIYHGQGGNEAYDRFWEFVQNSSSKDLQPLKEAISILQASVPKIDARRTLEIFTWMLLGDFSNRSDHPDVRFGVVLSVARSLPELFGYRLGDATEFFWDHLDDAIRVRSWRENLRSANERARSRVGELEASLSRLSDELGGFPELLLSVAKLWEGDVGRMVDMITNDPSHYCDPIRYNYSSIQSFPAPFILVHYGVNTYQAPDGCHSWSSDKIRPVFADEAKQRLLYTVLSPGRPWKELEAVTKTFGMQRIIDFIFSEEATPRALDEYYFQQIEPILEKKILRVF